MGQKKIYDKEYKVQAVKLGREVGFSKADKPLEKCVTDITEIKCSDGKLYTSAIFDCFDAAVPGLAMDTNMKAPLCVQTLKNAYNSFHDCSGLGRKDENG